MKAEPSHAIRRVGTAAIAFVLALPVTAIAASITGRVVDVDGQPVPRVMVTATNVETEFVGVAETSSTCEFVLGDLPLGSYRVLAERGGFAFRELTIALDRETIPALRISLAPLLGGQPAVPASRRPKNYSTVSLLFGTDRRPGATGAAQVTFSAERGELQVGTCEVSIPRDHRTGYFESPAFWKLEFRPDPEKHIALLSSATMGVQTFRALLRTRAREAGTKSSLVFVHGYNITFEEAARRTAQIAYDLKFTGVASLYSWPSNGAVLQYAADGEQAQRAARYFGDYLDLILADQGIDEVHLIAHSMGNRVLTAALQQLQAKTGAAGRPKIGQIAMVAPDIDEEFFRADIAPKIVGAGRRLTLYASNRDRALQLSKTLHKYPRAGDITDVVALVNGVDTIDVSTVDTDLVGHSYFADNRSVIADLFTLLRQNAAPSERFGMRPVSLGTGRYWRFAP